MNETPKGYDHVVESLEGLPLTNLYIPSQNGAFSTNIDYSRLCTNCNLQVVLRGHKEALLDIINSSTANDFIFGAVAWITDFDIIDALAAAANRGVFVQFVVQKEDFLRPDRSADNRQSWRSRLRFKYSMLGCKPFDDPLIYSLYSSPHKISGGCNRPPIQAIRCVGNYSSSAADNASVFPRMHNKYIVFGRVIGSSASSIEFNAYSVWMGSYNLSQNASMSFESVVILYSVQAADTFLKDFRLLFSLSEPLDWQSEWLCPQFKI